MNQLESFIPIKTFIFDVDGVFTDGKLLVMETGDLLRTMNVRDGFAVKKALEQGYRVVIITGGKSEGVKVRLNNLGVEDVYLGVSNKLSVYELVVDLYKLDEGEILYMGDDLPDYEVMRRVGVPACPADSVQEIKHIAQYISPINGGQGCVRDVIEKVLKINGHWV